MPDAAPTDLLMSARSQYIKHYQGYMEQACQRPVNLLRDDEWKSHGIEPFKIKLTDLDTILKPEADTAIADAQIVTEEIPTPPAAQPPTTPPIEEDDMSATFSTGSYVKVISGALTGHKGIIQTHDNIRATVNLENGVTAQIELANLARSRRGEPTTPAPLTPPAKGTAPATAPAATTSAPAAPKKKSAAKPAVTGAAVYRFKIKLFGKTTSDATEYPTKEAAEAAGNQKISALKAVLPDATPNLEIEEIARAVYTLEIIGQEPIEGDYDKLLAGAVKLINTMPLPKFNNGVSLEVKNKNKFITDLAEATGVDARILRLILTPSN
jgi:hypothetical protein